ncbi:MAG: hypothetical protein DRH12_16090 [Deltaproteobacteria bacterium]|nr:MAG: hypothetical protein DRH12_16090 [Deltaproteobacteria bacterium]
MKTKYGYSRYDWEQAKQEMKTILNERAKVCAMIPYSELAAQNRAIIIRPEPYAFAAMLGEISKKEDQAGRG